MPNRQQRRAAAKNGDDVTLTLTVGGRKIVVDLMECSALDEDDYEAVTGTGFMGLLDLMEDMSRVRLKHIAGLVWLEQRRRKPNLSYEDVAGEITMRDFTSIEVDQADEHGDGKQPAKKAAAGPPG